MPVVIPGAFLKHSRICEAFLLFRFLAGLALHFFLAPRATQISGVPSRRRNDCVCIATGTMGIRLHRLLVLNSANGNNVRNIDITQSRDRLRSLSLGGLA